MSERYVSKNPLFTAPYGARPVHTPAHKAIPVETLAPVVATLEQVSEEQIVREAMSKTHMPMYLTGFMLDIEQFNKMYKMPTVNVADENDALNRLANFHNILEEECKEIDELGAGHFTLEGLADLLGDIIVYCASEARRWNIPIDRVLHIIMQSNFSKMGPNGEPIYDERGKLMKGSNYWKPEEKIAELLAGEKNV